MLPAPAEHRTTDNPYIVRIGTKNFGSDSDQVRVIENEFDEAVRAHTYDLNLMYECWDAYMDLNGSQWDRKKPSNSTLPKKFST